MNDIDVLEQDRKTIEEIKAVLAQKDVDEGYKALFTAILDKYYFIQEETANLMKQVKKDEDNPIVFARIRERVKANNEFQNALFDIMFYNTREFKKKDK